MSGKLDRYTLDIMIHEALLTNGFQLIHTLQRPYRPHRTYFALNIHLTTVEFVFLFVGTKDHFRGLIDRNTNPCPALLQAMEDTQSYRLRWTVFPFAGAWFLCLLDSLIWFIDGYRNRRKSSKSRWTKFFLPKWLVWDNTKWTKSRILICGFGFLWWSFSLITLELFVIRNFHLYVQEFATNVTSNEDVWSYGQLLALLVALSGFAYAIRTWFLETMRLRVESAEGISILLAHATDNLTGSFGNRVSRPTAEDLSVDIFET